MGNPFLTRLLFTLMPMGLMIEDQVGRRAQFNTLRHALQHLTWFLNILYQGVGPLELPPGVHAGNDCRCLFLPLSLRLD